MATWQEQLAAQRAQIDSRVAAARRVYRQLGPWLDRYHGGLPVGVFAAFAQYESDGRMDAPGDPSLGEVGYFQITSTTPGRFGLPAESRYDPETNVFLGGLEYNDEAARFAAMYPGLVEPGSVDSWKIARLAFAVGVGGTKLLIHNAKPTERGNVYGALREYINRTNGIWLDTQSPTTVALRVHMVDVAWDVGMRAIGGTVGWPQKIPAPPNVTYKLSPSTLAVMDAAPNPWVTLALVGFVGWGLYKLFKK